MAWYQLSPMLRLSPAWPSVGKSTIAATSKCASQKSGLSLRRTSARTPSSAAISWASRASSPASSRVIRLMGGLWTVANATPPSRTRLSSL